jgi:hypothetical protein
MAMSATLLLGSLAEERRQQRSSRKTYEQGEGLLELGDLFLGERIGLRFMSEPFEQLLHMAVS